MRLEKWEILSSKKCCENSWVSVREDKVKLPSGTILDSYIVVDYCGAVGVLAVENNKMLLVRQYRYPIDKVSLEIPAGALLGKDSTNIKKSARAELLEEAGYTAKSIEHFHKYKNKSKYNPSPGSSNEEIYLVLAKGLTKVRNFTEGDVSFEVKWYKINHVVELIVSGEITHSPTIIGVLLGLEKGFFKKSK